MEKYLLLLYNVLGVPIASPSFSLAFSLVTGMIKKVLEITKNKKKKDN